MENKWSTGVSFLLNLPNEIIEEIKRFTHAISYARLAQTCKALRVEYPNAYWEIQSRGLKVSKVLCKADSRLHNHFMILGDECPRLSIHSVSDVVTVSARMFGLIRYLQKMQELAPNPDDVSSLATHPLAWYFLEPICDYSSPMRNLSTTRYEQRMTISSTHFDIAKPRKQSLMIVQYYTIAYRGRVVVSKIKVILPGVERQVQLTNHVNAFNLSEAVLDLLLDLPMSDKN